MMSKKSMGDVIKKCHENVYPTFETIAQALRDEGYIHKDDMREVVEVYEKWAGLPCWNERYVKLTRLEKEMWAAIKAVVERVK